MNKVKAIPAGYQAVTPYLFVNGAAAAIEFYKTAFGATEVLRLASPNGGVAHAEIQIRDSKVMLGEKCSPNGAPASSATADATVNLYLYVEDVDATIAKAIAAGAKSTMPISDKFYGDRSGAITDPFGHVWHLATHIEDVSPGELQKRSAEMFGKKPA